MKYIVGNWKSNKSSEEVEAWWREFAGVYKKHERVEALVAVPFVYLPMAAALRDDLEVKVSIAAQDVSPYPYGAYTGAVAAAMIAEWVDWAIVGHSERRNYFHETSGEVANKVSQLADAGLGVVLCVDAPYAQEQRAALGELPEKLVVAYEPLSAIGTGNPEDPKAVAETVAKVKEWYEGRTVIYGGSTTPENAGEYLGVPGVDGLLPGGASLDAGKLARMCEMAGS